MGAVKAILLVEDIVLKWGNGLLSEMKQSSSTSGIMDFMSLNEQFQVARQWGVISIPAPVLI